MSENNLDLRESIVFPDHYKFKEEEISKIIKSAHQNNMHIIMTEKDYYKIKKFNIKNIEYLKINLEITDKEKFLQTIKDIYDKKINYFFQASNLSIFFNWTYFRIANRRLFLTYFYYWGHILNQKQQLIKI